MSFSEWKKVELKEVIDFNPRESLPKNQLAKKVAMEKIKPFSKFIDDYEIAEFKGGTKFRNQDTLLARITPCLENGKTSQVTLLEDNEIGFGSTEYIVMRKKTGITDKDYIFYLAISPSFREVAIKSMVGSSGRQRVQQDELENLQINLPPLQEQKAIAATLSCLDDKIELNNRMNKNLEEMAQAIFKSWFVDFEPFQDGEFEESELGMIPKGWRVGTIGEVASISSGKRPPLKQDNSSAEIYIPVVGASSVMAYTSEKLFNEKILITGRVGTHGIIQRFNTPCWPSDNTLVIKSKYYEFMYQTLYGIDYKSMNRGSTQPLITQTDLKNIKIIIPTDSVLNDFEKLTLEIMTIWYENKNQNNILIQARDTLLPKLMSGEIRVPLEEVQ